MISEDSRQYILDLRGLKGTLQAGTYDVCFLYVDVNLVIKEGVVRVLFNEDVGVETIHLLDFPAPFCIDGRRRIEYVRRMR